MQHPDAPRSFGSILRGGIEYGHGLATISLVGELDVAGVDQFGAAVREVEATRPRAIVVNLHALDFLGSSGMKALIEADARARGQHEFVVLNGSGPAHRALTLAGLDEVLTMVGSVDEAPGGADDVTR